MGIILYLVGSKIGGTLCAGATNKVQLGTVLKTLSADVKEQLSVMQKYKLKAA